MHRKQKRWLKNELLHMVIFRRSYLSLPFKIIFQLLLIKKKKLISWGEQLFCAQGPRVVGSIHVFLGHSDVDKLAIPEYTGIEK